MGNLILHADDSYQHINSLEMTPKHIDVMTFTNQSDPSYQKGTVYFNPSEFIKIHQTSSFGLNNMQSNFFNLYNRICTTFGYRSWVSINLKNFWDLSDIEKQVEQFKGNIHLYLCPNYSGQSEGHVFSTSAEDDILKLNTIVTRHFKGSFKISNNNLNENIVLKYLNDQNIGKVTLSREYNYSRSETKIHIWSYDPKLNIEEKELGVLLNLKFGDSIEDVAL